MGMLSRYVLAGERITTVILQDFKDTGYSLFIISASCLDFRCELSVVPDAIPVACFHDSLP